jgi:hypothetical protein
MVCSPFALPAQETTAADLFSKAPPEIDNVLRERVTRFYQLHVDGKFRAADQFVAEDSKDIYFEGDHNRWRGFKIAKIEYTDNFTKAKVMTNCQHSFKHAGQEFPAVVPVVSRWKVENGQWLWYVVPEKGGATTPWGIMQGAPEAKGGQAAPPALPNMAVAAAAIRQAVKADKREVMLSSFKPAHDEVLLANGLPGPVTFHVEYQAFPGFVAKLAQDTVGKGESGRLLLTVDPKDDKPKPTTVVTVVVDQTGQRIPVKVMFDVPAEMKKMFSR